MHHLCEIYDFFFGIKVPGVRIILLWNQQGSYFDIQTMKSCFLNWLETVVPGTWEQCSGQIVIAQGKNIIRPSTDPFFWNGIEWEWYFYLLLQTRACLETPNVEYPQNWYTLERYLNDGVL